MDGRRPRWASALPKVTPLRRGNHEDRVRGGPGGRWIRTIGPSCTTSTRIGLNETPECTNAAAVGCQDAAPPEHFTGAHAFRLTLRAHKEARRSDRRESSGATRDLRANHPCKLLVMLGCSVLLPALSAGRRAVCP